MISCVIYFKNCQIFRKFLWLAKWLYFFCHYSCPVWLSFYNINFRLLGENQCFNRGINFSSIFSPHLVPNPSSWTLKYKKPKKILDIAIFVIFCSILWFIFRVLRLHQLFLLLSIEKKVSSKSISFWFLPFQIFPNMITSVIF